MRPKSPGARVSVPAPASRSGPASPSRRGWLGAAALFVLPGPGGYREAWAQQQAGPQAQAQAQTQTQIQIQIQIQAPPKAKPDVPLPAIGSTLVLPDVTLLDGSTIDAVARRGKATVLYWWASWCPFCAEQSPLIDKLWRSERDNGLLVLGLSIDKTAKVAADHLKRKGYQFPSAWLSPDLEKQLPKPKGLPVTIVLDADGRVLAAESGQMFAEDVADLARWAPGRNDRRPG